jgi:hypothetical protein
MNHRSIKIGTREDYFEQSSLRLVKRGMATGHRFLKQSPFSAPGDSGSLVYLVQGLTLVPIALLNIFAH